MLMPAHPLASGLAVLFPGWQLYQVWPLSGGISAQTTACELTDAQGQRQRVVVRQLGSAVLARRPDAALTEYRILQALAQAGVAAPRPLACDPDGRVLGAPALVMTHLHGAPDNDPPDMGLALRQMAAELARIHQLRALPGAELPAYSSGAQRLLDSPAVQAADALGWVGRLRDSLRARGLPVADHPLGLLHGDFWPGNLLWRDGQLCAVVDWEDAAWGDPLADLALARLDVFWRWGPEGMALFTEHYVRCQALNTRHLPYWDAVAALRPLGRLALWAAGWAQLGGPVLTLADFERGHAAFGLQVLAALEKTALP